MRELKSIEEKILDSALHLIGSRGSSKVPIRAIAKEAGVNVSAINYYFGTKEEMLRQTKEFYITNTTAIFNILDKEGYSEEEQLVLFANEIMEYTLRYSGLGVILKEANKLKDEDEISSKVINVSNELHCKLKNLMNKVIPCESIKEQYNFLVFLSALIYPIDKGDVLNDEGTILKDKDKRIDYIKHLIEVLKG